MRASLANLNVQENWNGISRLNSGANLQTLRTEGIEHFVVASTYLFLMEDCTINKTIEITWYAKFYPVHSTCRVLTHHEVEFSIQSTLLVSRTSFAQPMLRIYSPIPISWITIEAIRSRFQMLALYCVIQCFRLTSPALSLSSIYVSWLLVLMCKLINFLARNKLDVPVDYTPRW